MCGCMCADSAWACRGVWGEGGIALSLLFLLRGDGGWIGGRPKAAMSRSVVFNDVCGKVCVCVC